VNGLHGVLAMSTLFIRILLPLFCTIMCYFPCFAVEAPRNPNSAKECAICHFRWIDTFFIDGKGTDLVDYQEKKVVAEPEICFSCHDGSVADSRGKVYNDHRHPINKPPPPDMEIPAIFPLDKQGNMQCFTCHTAHGVSGEMGIERAVFVRASNTNSDMCMMCHKGKDGGPAVGNHPIGTTKLVIPKELKQLGSVEGSAPKQIICQTCHTVHGSPFDNFLVENNKDSARLCLDCHKDKVGLINTGHDLRRTAPDERNIKGQTPQQSGICGSCHLVHGAKKAALWARKVPEQYANQAEAACLGCHNKKGPGHKKILSGYSHPMGMLLDSRRMQPQLPGYDAKGQRVSLQSKQGLLTCQTCHDPHTSGSKRQAKMNPPVSSFLRVADGEIEKLCTQCHVNEGRIARSDHDLRLTGQKAKNSKGQLPNESGLCGVCHLVHGADNKTLWARNECGKSCDPAQKLCLSCHNGKGVAGKKTISDYSHPIDIRPSASGINTTLPLYDQSGKIAQDGRIGCLTCHNPHQWNPRKTRGPGGGKGEGNGQNSFLRLVAAPQPVLCGNCHPAKAYVEKTDHDLTITAPATKNIMGQTSEESGVCGSCHLVHNGPNKVRLWAQEYGRGKSILDRMCNGCHVETGSGKSKIPLVSTHPEKQLIANPGRDVEGRANYFPLFNEDTGELITISDIACASCHDVHQWDPKINSMGSGNNIEGRTNNSFLRMQTYNMICKDCHGLDALFRFKYYHDSSKRKPSLTP
jgi:predicted CXXCH cytochrome family protein